MKFRHTLYSRNTIYCSDFHYPTSDLAFYHKITYYVGLKVFNHLPSYVKDILQDIKELK